MVRSQVGRRYIDTSLLDIKVLHGVVRFQGVLRVLRTHMHIDLRQEMEIIGTILRGKQGIREVVWDVTLRS